jgi:hypothetical protein
VHIPQWCGCHNRHGHNHHKVEGVEGGDRPLSPPLSPGGNGRDTDGRVLQVGHTGFAVSQVCSTGFAGVWT